MRDRINDSVRLALMIEAIANIESFMIGIQDVEQFSDSKMLCHAVIYNLQCVGESVYRLSRGFREAHPEQDWDAIEGLRHVLVHDYYQVSINRIWTIVVRDLPKLRTDLNEILEHEPGALL